MSELRSPAGYFARTWYLQRRPAALCTQQVLVPDLDFRGEARGCFWAPQGIAGRAKVRVPGMRGWSGAEGTGLRGSLPWAVEHYLPTPAASTWWTTEGSGMSGERGEKGRCLTQSLEDSS